MSAGQDAPAPRVSDGEDELLAAMERANDWLSPTERRELEQSHLNAINALFRLADKWVAEHRAEIASLNARIAMLTDALRPFAEAARRFSCTIGPDGVDDDLTVIAYIACRPECEATLGTAHFSAAAAAVKTEGA